MCSGRPSEVPVTFVGQWETSERQWLTDELSAWLNVRERQLCETLTPSSVQRLVLTAEGDNITVTFSVADVQHQRQLSGELEGTELRRYALAATTEELLRSTWAALALKRFTFGAAAGAPVLRGGSIFVGAHVFLEWWPAAPVSMALQLGLHPLLSRTLPPTVQLNGFLPFLKLRAAWLPLTLGPLRIGPVAGVEGGLILLSFTAQEIPQRTPWWFAASAGLSTSLRLPKLVLSASAELAFAPLGATVQDEGRAVLTLNGIHGNFQLSAAVPF
jgi:hypothetical protein